MLGAQITDRVAFFPCIGNNGDDDFNQRVHSDAQRAARDAREKRINASNA
jgi:hypothetical protein